MLLVDPEHEQLLDEAAAPGVKHRFVLGKDYDDGLLRPERDPVPWENPDEDATATINYTSGTTARPKGVQLTHRNIWINAVTFGLHTGVTDRDVYLHTLPMFHCNGWGMPFTMAGLGVPQVVLRKVDGTEILRRVAAARRDARLRRARGVERRARGGRDAGTGPIPGRDTMRIVVAGAPPPTRVIARVEEELGWEFTQIYGLTETSPLVTSNRTRAEWDDEEPASNAPGCSRGPAHRRSAPR